jgi:hypothetical protein
MAQWHKLSASPEPLNAHNRGAGPRLSPTRFSLTGADSDAGASVAEPVRRAAKRKTLYVIKNSSERGTGAAMWAIIVDRLPGPVCGWLGSDAAERLECNERQTFGSAHPLTAIPVSANIDRAKRSRVKRQSRKRMADMAVRKSGRVELRCSPRLAMIEPQTGGNFSAHGNSLTRPDDIPRTPCVRKDAVRRIRSAGRSHARRVISGSTASGSYARPCYMGSIARQHAGHGHEKLCNPQAGIRSLD